jgi:hypothetical protein
VGGVSALDPVGKSYAQSQVNAQSQEAHLNKLLNEAIGLINAEVTDSYGQSVNLPADSELTRALCQLKGSMQSGLAA